MGLTIVPLDSSSGSAIMSTLRRGALVGLLSDRDLAGNGIEVEFFGETTTMPAGPATLALRSGAQLVTGAVLPTFNEQIDMGVFDAFQVPYSALQRGWNSAGDCLSCQSTAVKTSSKSSRRSIFWRPRSNRQNRGSKQS